MKKKVKQTVVSSIIKGDVKQKIDAEKIDEIIQKIKHAELSSLEQLVSDKASERTEFDTLENTVLSNKEILFNDMKNMVGRGEIKEILHKLVDLVPTHYPKFNNETLLQLSKYNRIEKSVRLGTLDRDNINIEMNNLINSVLKLLDELESSS